MGIDFLRRTAPSFHRALDRQAVALRTPTLFDAHISSLARTACADVTSGVGIVAGEKVLLRIQNGRLVMQRDNMVVGVFSNPPSEYLTRIEAGAGVAIGEVKTVRPLSGEAEVAFERD